MNRIIEILIGTIMIFITIFFFVMAYEKSGKSQELKDHYKLFAYFENIGGLKTGAEVMISGVKIGRITNVTLDHNNYLAKAEISITDSVKIPSDSIISVASSNFLGDKYLKISLGYNQTILKDQDFIEDTQSTVEIEDIIRKFLSGSLQKMNQDFSNNSNTEEKNFQEHIVDEFQSAKNIG